MVSATALAMEAFAADEPSLEQQYVSFSLAREHFAFPMQQVREIVRPPAIVPVPLTPPAFLGLANLRGNVLPVMDLRALLGLERREADTTSRVVVVERGQVLGLMVDRIARVFAPEADQFDEAAGIQGPVDSRLLSGVIKGGEGQGLVQLLDLEALLADQFRAGDGAGVLTSPAGGQQRTVRAAEPEEEDLLQLVSFLLAGQECAFDIGVVQEIVRLPETVNQLPRSPGHILGMIELRGRLLPLIGLRQLFELDPVEADEHHRIVVLGIPGRGHAVGVVVDRIREVLHVPRDLLDLKPPLLEQQGGLDEIDGICRLEGGKRLVSVIDGQALLQDPAVRAAANEAKENEMVTDPEALQEEEDEDLTQLVVFTLGDQEYGVLIESVQEITRIPEEMNRVPKTPDFIEGMVNLRGTVLPVVDMRSRFGLPRMERNERQRILVLDLDGTRTGFITDAVSEVLRIPREAIEPAPPLSEEQARVLGRVANLRESKRMIQILDAGELLDEGQKQALQEV